MQVFKFGGTSVGSPARMRRVASLIDDGARKIIVLSAVSGTTNKLEAFGQLAAEGRFAEAGELLAVLREEYESFIYDLFEDRADCQHSRGILDLHFQRLERALEREFDTVAGRTVLAQGELLSTHLFQFYLRTQGIDAVLLPALDFMRTDEQGEPQAEVIRRGLDNLLASHPDANYFITQGYICRNAREEIDNLKRGGSDYTATLIGAVVGAEEIQIWTDIDGIHNNDPRVVEHTFPVRRVSYREAAELAYFGAKILHPTCVLPAEHLQIPIRLRNTFAPEAEGTLISNQASGSPVAAVAAKDGIVAIKIRSHRMLMAYGFLRRVFEVFEKYRTPIDMITTSEVAVSLTIDDTTHLAAILEELKSFGEVSLDASQTIICVVGDNLQQKAGHARRILSALEDTPIRMVSYGGSVNNISILISSEYKERALRLLNRQLFPKLAGLYAE
jgi:aspartate kinase